ncbi:MAG: ribosomal L7Ae/L30e/S12e/Gadd45 family protein [Sarcina sp.]
MVEKLFENKVIGIKQSSKAIQHDKGKILYVAIDANKKLVAPIVEIAKTKSIDIIYVSTMKKLGLMCDIDVKASVALILN